MHSHAPAEADRTPDSAPEIGTPQHYRWLDGIVRAVLVLNLMDALFTLIWVRLGLAREANTLLERLVDENAVGFVLVKLALVSLGSWLLWRFRRRPGAVIGIFAAFLAYYFILLYHLQFAAEILRRHWAAS